MRQGGQFFSIAFSIDGLMYDVGSCSPVGAAIGRPLIKCRAVGYLLSSITFMRLMTLYST